MSVSVCIPTYNYGHLIGRAISSVLDQEHVTEILVLDNASTDSTEQVVSQFKDTRLHYSRSEINLGFARNLQRGFELSKSEFIQFLCADDFLYPDCLRQTVAMLEQNSGMSFAHTGHDLVDLEEKRLERRIYDWAPKTGSEDFLKHIAAHGLWGICLSSALIRREDLKNAGGVDTELGFAADFGMWLQLCLKKEVGYVPQSLTAYRVHPGQATGVFVPGLKQKLFEKTLEKMRGSGISFSGAEAAFKRMALSAAVRELPRRKIEGDSIRVLIADIRGLIKKYGAYFFKPDLFVFTAVVFLPKNFLKWTQTFYRKPRRES